MAEHAHTAIPAYRMNPAEDKILFSGDLQPGMLVLPEDPGKRATFQDTAEDAPVKRQQFRKIIRRLNLTPTIMFVGQWDDGYKESHTSDAAASWIVKKSSITPDPCSTTTAHDPHPWIDVNGREFECPGASE